MKKLVLKKETLRTLTDAETAAVNGGGDTGTVGSCTSECGQVAIRPQAIDATWGCFSLITAPSYKLY